MDLRAGGDITIGHEYGAGLDQFNTFNTNFGTGKWYHLVATRDASAKEWKLYVNGTQFGSTYSYTNNPTGGTTATLMIGNDLNSGSVFDGIIDNVIIYNRTISPEQVLSNYEHGYANLVSNETRKVQNWTTEVKLNDGKSDSTTLTNDIQIRNAQPDAFSLLEPNNGNFSLFNRTPYFDWTNATDPDGDAITYTINVTHPVCPDIHSVVGADSNFTPSSYLCTTYNSTQNYTWSVTASDPDGNKTYSQTWTFRIKSWVIINLTRESVDFDKILRTVSNDTSDDKPQPLLLQNDGNVPVNISGNVTDPLWSNATLNTSNFQWKIASTAAEPNSYNNVNTLTTFTNVSDIIVFLINGLHFDNVNDEAEIDLNITATLDEPPGEKGSSLLFIAEAR